MSKRELNVSRWLEAHSDRNSELSVLPRSVLLVHGLGDDNYQLIIADFMQSRLRAYKQMLISDVILNDIPNSLIAFYINHLEPRIPAVAVACGSNLFIYKNKKPFFKFRIPSSPILPLETDFWEKCSSTIPFDINKGIEELSTAPVTFLSGRSQELLFTSSPQNFTKMYQYKPLIKESSITCMCTLKKSSHDKYAPSCPILATESGNIYILDPQTLTTLKQANICSKRSTPSTISSVGLYDVDYKIIIGCREGHICILMKGWLEGKSIIEFVDDIVDIVIIPADNFIVVASKPKTLSCFTKRGLNLWSIRTMFSVTCICLLPIYHMNINLVAVGLIGGTVQLYNGRHVVDYVTVPESPSAITFGQLGQEENVMVIITLAGTITYKILKRTADFNIKFKENIPVLHSRPIPLPKRSKLFLEQSLREKSIATDMHQFFQQDLIRLRKKNALELVNCIEILKNKELKIEVKIFGLGPRFTVILILENLNNGKNLNELTVIFHTKPSVYNISSSVAKIPKMPPRCQYKLKIQLKELSNKNQCSAVKMSPAPALNICVTKHLYIQPSFAATVRLLPADEISY